jgi:hypothetical protein
MGEDLPDMLMFVFALTLVDVKSVKNRVRVLAVEVNPSSLQNLVLTWETGKGVVDCLVSQCGTLDSRLLWCVGDELVWSSQC